jgi:hypothetical protein
MENASSRYFLKSIAAIFEHQPVFSLLEMFEFIGTAISASLMLLASLFGQDAQAVHEIDFVDSGLGRVAVIGNKDMPPIDVNSSLQLLAIELKSFNADLSQ